MKNIGILINFINPITAAITKGSAINAKIKSIII